MPRRGRHNRHRPRDASAPAHSQSHRLSRSESPPPRHAHRWNNSNAVRAFQTPHRNRTPRVPNSAVSDRAGIRTYHDRLHPAVISAYANLKATTTRLSIELEKLVTQVNEIAPTRDHMEWNFSPATIVYVPTKDVSPDDRKLDTNSALLPPSSRFNNFKLSGNGVNTHKSNQIKAPIMTPAHPIVANLDPAYYPSGPQTTLLQHQSTQYPSRFNNSPPVTLTNYNAPLNTTDSPAKNPMVIDSMLQTLPRFESDHEQVQPLLQDRPSTTAPASILGHTDPSTNSNHTDYLSPSFPFSQHRTYPLDDEDNETKTQRQRSTNENMRLGQWIRDGGHRT